MPLEAMEPTYFLIFLATSHELLRRFDCQVSIFRAVKTPRLVVQHMPSYAPYTMRHVSRPLSIFGLPVEQTRVQSYAQETLLG